MKNAEISNSLFDSSLKFFRCDTDIAIGFRKLAEKVMYMLVDGDDVPCCKIR